MDREPKKFPRTPFKSSAHQRSTFGDPNFKGDINGAACANLNEKLWLYFYLNTTILLGNLGSF